MNLIATDDLTLIAGGGLTGLSVARYLSGLGRRFCVYDSRDNESIAYAVKEIEDSAVCFLGDFHDDYLDGVSQIVVSPGVSMGAPLVIKAKKLDIPICSEITLFLEAASAPVVGITGSNGKSTVTTMVGLAANRSGIACAVGGNLGVPALDLLSADVELYVLELSSFQLETTDNAGLFVAAHLNLSADHLDRHGTMQEYFRVKQKVFHAAERVVYKLSEPLTQPPLIKSTQRYGFGLSPSVEKRETQFFLSLDKTQLFRDGTCLMSAADVKQKGAHNIENVLATLAIASAANIPLASVIEVAKTFSGLPHRCEWVRDLQNVSFINDSKATNVGSTIAALKGFAYEADAKSIILIAGGEGKGADFSELGNAIAESVKSVVLIGRDAPLIDRAIDSRVETYFAKDLGHAVDKSFECADRGDLVIFSPACASFDMFVNFEARGDAYKQAVRRLST